MVLLPECPPVGRVGLPPECLPAVPLPECLLDPAVHLPVAPLWLDPVALPRDAPLWDLWPLEEWLSVA